MKQHERKTGFTLLEIMIVVALIGLLAAIAVPFISKARITAQNTRFVSDLRIAAAAFEMYAMETGRFPPDANPGILPAGIGNYFKSFDWTAPTPIGGQWDWDYNQTQFGYMAGVAVYFGANGVDEDRMRTIDALIDDGNLQDGVFRRRNGGYAYILEF